MSTAQLPSAAERLLALLPDIFRIRDAEQAVRIAAAQGFPAPDPLSDTAEGPLVTLLAALGQQLDLLEAEVDWLYEDQFIETCADWMVPYLGALVGARILDVGDAESARQQVADTIRNRRAKGTAWALANRTRNIMVAPAEAIEYGAHVVQTTHLNFPGDGRAMTVAVNGAPGKLLGLPSTVGQHLVELRDMREGGRFAPRNVGARVWTRRSIAHGEVVPTPAAGVAGGYRFDPLGRDIALWAFPRELSETDKLRSRLLPDQVPGPIPLVAAVAYPKDYYGPGDSILLSIAGVDRPVEQICFCDLGDDGGPGQWNAHGLPDELDRIRIDPTRGRFLLPGGGAGVDPSSIRVRYHFGTALHFGRELCVGGAQRETADAAAEARMRALFGARDRRPHVPIAFAAPAVIAQDASPAQVSALLGQALGNLANQPALRIDFGGTLAPPAGTALPPGADLELRGGDGVWPTLILPQAWQIGAGEASTLTLRGLRLAGDTLHVLAEGLRQLTLIDCTVVPGSGSIHIEEPGCKLLALRCILGAIRVAPAVEIDLVDCLVDSGAADMPAIAALGGTAGGILWSRRCTILGDVRLLAFDEVDDTLFAARPDRTLADPPVSARRLQSGCARYSAVPRGAIVPRRYRCFPSENDTRSPAPVFESLDYGQAGYGALVPANPDGLLLGAENGGEMGIGNGTSYHRRKRLLDRDLLDWVPFGMAAATEWMG
ncbi:hypothetical protein S2M10_23400 [Sphingomonas sp. S2M10]|uniref:hypothetical protein n=1 Tax=Sphingomonas sp. S2M10 TaxID=2705010 RepID=UPI001456A8A8|nr:hypothetical protein [Sphingomonas sp. S2M10]NLS27345.1 hypothetical protein [Sphingomonas sp. S2M10]